VVSLAGAEFVYMNNLNEGFNGAIGSAQVGYPIGVLRGFDFARCGRGLLIDVDGDGTAENIDALCGPNAKSGALFLWEDGLPVVDPAERVIADPNPKYTLGFNSAVRVGDNLQISTQVDVRKGGEMWNGTRGILYRFGTHGDTEIRDQTGGYCDNWSTDVYPVCAGPGVGIQAFQSPEDWQNWFLTEGGGFGTTGVQFIEDAGFVKLREIALQYTFRGRSRPSTSEWRGVT
jgi:hypothetical protein